MGTAEKLKMHQLIDIVESNEEWLMGRILYYAKYHNYADYTSTLQESWRVSISGLSSAIIKAIGHYKDNIPQFSPHDDYISDPISEFALIEARRHRERGIDLGMFLGLLKYYRQTYEDLIKEKGFKHKEHFQKYLVRCFDRFELSLCVEWASLNIDIYVKELQNKNKAMTNEKNKYLTLFESLIEPVLFIDNDGFIENMNQAAAVHLGYKNGTGKFYYNEQEILTNIARNKMPIKTVIPWLNSYFTQFVKSNAQEQNLEINQILSGSERYFDVSFSKMADISQKFTGVIIVLREITAEILTEKIKIEKERLQGVVEMAGTVCHELNQPLQGIIGYSDLILANIDSESDTQKKLLKIKKQIERIASITKQLMSITRYKTRDYVKGEKIIDLDKSSKKNND